ncbi:ribonuclease P protein component [Clostridium transplantifaecale]|uniref:ribonuclease P protein component n=1 Tax=Clostridium transplantifaecale TaxID=2479838 RepID=UPI000F63B3CB|nr:ribonuclease P protein component [Clostridium transplantifaecale]
MKKFNSIKKNNDFQKVYRTGKSYANRLLIMYVMRAEREDTRIGISVSKKVGNSVVRHHVTRLVRESYRLNKDKVKTGLDIVVVARAAAKDSDFKKIESAYMHLCGLHNILENRSENID